VKQLSPLVTTLDRVQARADALAESRRDVARVELAKFQDHDVELRLYSGILLHARLIGVTKEYAIVEHHAGGVAVIELATVAAVVDEASAG